MSAWVLTRADAPADCEAWADGLFDQAINTWSSLGYVVAGAAIAVAVIRRRLPAAFAVLAVVTTFEGVGSVLYHGRPGDVSQAVHDLALVAMVGFVAGWHVGRCIAAAATGSIAGATVGLIGGVGIVAAGGLGGGVNVLVGAGVAATAAAELLARRRGLAPVWRSGLVVALAAAVAAWAAGSAASPLCDPGSPWQWHAVWHLLSAAITFWWADAAAGAVVSPPPRLTRRAADRALGLAARLIGQAFFRSIELVGRDQLPAGRPVLLVVNHPNGFVDPVVVTAALGRMPRFLAKAALWRVPPARPLLALVGALPVHRREDGDRVEANDDVFAACHEALATGATVAIFPEGTTGDRPTLDRVKSGAARISLGATAGVDDLAVVPVGVAFESRTATRPRAVLVIGPPIPFADLDRDEPTSVATLTERIAAALAAVSPEFESVEAREVLRAAASVAVADRHRFGPPPFAEVESLARRAGRAPAAAVGAIDLALRDYSLQLQLVGLTDAHVAGRLHRRSLLLAAVLAVLFGSVVLTATVLHLPAITVTLAATAAVRATATKGTVRLLVGLSTGALTWIVVGLVTADGWGVLAAAAVLAVEAHLALLVWPSFVSLVARCWGWLRTRDRGELMRPVLAGRAAVATAVLDAAGEPR